MESERPNITLIMKSIDSIGHKVDKIDEDMQYVKGELVRNEEWHKVLNKSVQGIHEAVYGNGKAGLSQEIKCIDDAVGKNSEKIDALNQRFRGVAELRKEENERNWLEKQEWVKGWRGLIFTILTTAATVTITLMAQNYIFNP